MFSVIFPAEFFICFAAVSKFIISGSLRYRREIDEAKAAYRQLTGAFKSKCARLEIAVSR